MCYKLPGPRCSAHAKEALDKATKTFYKNRTTENLIVLRQKEEEYLTTPEGIKRLREKGDNSLAEYFTQVRETKLKEYHLAHGKPNFLHKLFSSRKGTERESVCATDEHRFTDEPYKMIKDEAGVWLVLQDAPLREDAEYGWWLIAPKNAETGHLCASRQCGQYLSKKALNNSKYKAGIYALETKCDHCSRMVPLDEGGGSVTQESLSFIQNPEQLKSTTFYHASSNNNLESNLDPDKSMYIGTSTAAIMRATYGRHNSTCQRFTYYKVTLKPDAEISPIPLDDDDSFHEKPSSHSNLDDSKVHMYLNQFEDRGSISLRVRPEHINIERVRKSDLM